MTITNGTAAPWAIGAVVLALAGGALPAGAHGDAARSDGTSGTAAPPATAARTQGLRVAGRRAWRAASVVANPDHNTPTDHWDEGIKDPVSRLQVETLDANIKDFGALVYFPFKHANQGIIHVIGPENGTTLPGMTVVCGDSHTATHGAFGACLLYTSPSPRDRTRSRMPSSA